MAERMNVTVLLSQGTGPGAVAVVKTPHSEENLRVPAALVTEGTGFDLAQMPGKRLVALVQDGELVGFERP